METQTYKNLKDLPQTNFPEWCIVHHSGGTDADPLADTSHHTAKIMEAYHISKGWDGLGYQYVIHKDGAVWKGRPEHRNGAHTVGYNEKSIGICLAGNFDATMPTTGQIEALKTLLKDIQARYPKITSDKIVPHRKFATKSCYGNKLSDTWASDLVKVAKPTKEDINKKMVELQDMINKF